MKAQICRDCTHEKDRCFCPPNSTCEKYSPKEPERVPKSEEDLIKALKRIAVGIQFKCLGCDHEDNCSLYGCAVIKKAIAVIENQKA